MDLPLKHAPGEKKPPCNEGDPTDGRDRPQPGRIREYEHVQGSGEKDDACQKAIPGALDGSPCPRLGCGPPDQKQGKRMVHLIRHRCTKRLEPVRRDAPLKAMGPEGPRSYGDGGKNGSNREEGSHCTSAAECTNDYSVWSDDGSRRSCSNATSETSPPSGTVSRSASPHSRSSR